MPMPMTRLEQEAYEEMLYTMPRIVEVLERIAKALETMEASDGDNVSKARDD